MNLDRKLIKSQAKELIRGKVMKLFITILVVTLCTSGITLVINAITMPDDIDELFENPGNYFEHFDDDFNLYGFGDYDDYDDYDDYYDDDYNPYEDDFESFGTNNNSGRSDFYKFGTSFVPTGAKTVIDSEEAKTLSVNPSAARALSYISIALELLLFPLTIALAYYFVLFIRGREFSGTEGLKFIFKEAFTKEYGKKIGVGVLRFLIMWGLAIISILILFIPMWIFYYSSYFAFEIMCDNPQLSPMEAIKLSKKMIKGNRSELFVLDLSFIPWGILCVFIFPAIYVLPYIYTTKALYYENFRLRAIAQGRVTEDDFLTDAQKMRKYAVSGTYQTNQNQQQGYADAASGANQYANGAGYYNPQQNNGNTYTAPQENNTQTQQPTEPTQPTETAPQENTYTYTPPSEE